MFNLFDSFGDGWNGGFFDVMIGNIIIIYIFDNFNDDGSFNFFVLIVMEGDMIILDFIVGGFGLEVFYNFVDVEFIVIFEDGLVGVFLFGVVFIVSVVCFFCLLLFIGGIDIENICVFCVDVFLIFFDLEGFMIIEFGEVGFMLGMGIFKIIFGVFIIFFNFLENIGYEVYLFVVCVNGDISIIIGFYFFFILFVNDVGVVELFDLVIVCNLGIVDSIILVIFNFGGVFQIFIFYNFVVNGIFGGVNMFMDGFFIGVIGMDSMDIVQFDVFYDLFEFGEYLFEIWMDLEGDSVCINDIICVFIVNILEVMIYFYY